MDPSRYAVFEQLCRNRGVPSGQRLLLEATLKPLAHWCTAAAAAQDRAFVLGISGAQGSGKSVLSALLAWLLRQEHGLCVATLSLDDLYLTQAARRERARALHPLFATRGVPGTHDLALGRRVLGALKTSTSNGTAAGTAASLRRVALPRFDKASDDRAPQTLWPQVALPVDVVLFEGWCIGAPPQEEAALAAPVNDLERHADPHGVWRRAVNTTLANDYPALFAFIDRLLFLQVPDFSSVLAWRTLQEQHLRAAEGPASGLSDAGLGRFVAHFERLTQHMLACMCQHADHVLAVDRSHTLAPFVP